MKRNFVVPAVTLLLTTLTKAQDVGSVQYSWITPAAPDFTSTLTIGDLYNISWESDLIDSFATYAPSADVSSVDLWITDYNLHIYSQLIAARENLNTITSLSWRVDIPSDELLATTQWVFRWLPQGVDYSETSEQVSSPGFTVQNLTETATTTASSTATPAVTPSSDPSTPASHTASSGTLSSATASPTDASGAAAAPDSSAVSHGLSAGAKAGIAIGVIIGAALLLGLGWFLARKMGKKPPNETGYQYDMKSANYTQQPYYAPTMQSRTQVSELESGLSRSAPSQELPGQ